MSNFAAQLAARKAQMDRNLPLWSTNEHAETSRVKVPADKFNKVISHIHVHAARASMGGTTPVAHFRLYLQLKGEASSVMLNSYGSGSSGQTRLLIEYYDYPFSTSASKLAVHTIAVRQEFTVYQAITALLNRNRDHYRLDPMSGSGCRYWCQVVLHDFGEYGWVEAGAAATVEHVTSLVKAQYPDVNVPVPAPVGQFF